jgi:hypothetical protein
MTASVLEENFTIVGYYAPSSGNFRINNQQDASSIQNVILSQNSTCFGHLLCPSSGAISCTCGNWYVSFMLCGRCSGHITCIRSYQLYTWQLVCFIHVMWPLQWSRNLHETYQLPCVQLITPDDGHSRCPKHVEFRDKIKFWVLDASCCLFIQRLSRCMVT